MLPLDQEDYYIVLEICMSAEQLFEYAISNVCVISGEKYVHSHCKNLECACFTMHALEINDLGHCLRYANINLSKK